MIKANDLQVGNYVSLNNMIEVVKSISTGLDHNGDKFDTIETKRTFGHEDKDFKPIPLTEDWLNKFGFETHNSVDKIKGTEQYKDLTYYTKSLSDNKYNDLSLISSYVETNDVYVELFPYEDFKYKYVHQVQNVYHSITGKELKIRK